MECKNIGTKNILMTAFDEAGIFMPVEDDAKSILMSALDEARLFAQDEWSEEDEAKLTDSERTNLKKHDEARHKGRFDPKTMTCKFREKVKEGAKIEELKDEVDDPDITQDPDVSGLQQEIADHQSTKEEVSNAEVEFRQILAEQFPDLDGDKILDEIIQVRGDAPRKLAFQKLIKEHTPVIRKVEAPEFHKSIIEAKNHKHLIKHGV